MVFAGAYVNPAAIGGGGGSSIASEFEWESVYDVDFTAEATQMPTANNLTVGGVTFYGRNLAEASTAQITNGVGLVIETVNGGAATIELFQAATAGPRFEANLDDLYAWEPTDWVSLALDCTFAFTNAANQFSFAGAVLGWVLQAGAGTGTATSQSVQTLRGLAANVESGWIRGNANVNGGEQLFQRAGTPDQDNTSSVRVDLLGLGGVAEHYNGDAYSAGWPAWQTLSGTRPSLNTNNAHVIQPSAATITTTPRLRAMIYAGRAGNNAQLASITCKRMEVFRISRQYPT